MFPRPRIRFWLPALALAIGVVVTLAPARSAGPRAQLVQARADAAAKAFSAHEADYRAGRATLDSLYAWSVHWFEAQGGKGSAGPAGEHLKRMQALEAQVKARYQAGATSAGDVAAAEYYRAEAELWLYDAQGGKP